MMHAFIIPIMPVNTGTYRTQVRALATGVYDTLQTGFDINGNIVTPLLSNNAENICTRFELKGVVPSIETHVFVGWHPNVAANILDRYSDEQWTNLHQKAFNPPPDPIDEAFMIFMLKLEAAQHGCAKYSLLRPGDSLVTLNPADLLSRFVSF